MGGIDFLGEPSDLSGESATRALARGQPWQPDCPLNNMHLRNASIRFLLLVVGSAFGSAHVEPGTEFTLEQRPVDAGIWLPSHFVTRVNARVLFSPRRYTDDERYSDYRRSSGARGQESRAQAKAR